MLISSPFTINLAAADEAVLAVRARSARTEHRDPVGAKIILAAARGPTNAAIAAGLRIHVDTVPKWRGRYAVHGLDGLKDRPRPGRPRMFTPVQVAGIKALACTPQERDVPLLRCSGAELAVRAVTEGLVESISPAKAARVLDLYARQFDGEPLGPDEYVTSADEKSQLQALRRRPDWTRHPGEPGGSSSNTVGAGPLPTSPPTTSTVPK